MTGDHFYLVGESVTDPILYKGCGLDGIYLLNGYEYWEHEGDSYINISDIDGLHNAIGRYLVSNRKSLSPKEIRFLRKTMGLTQAELAAKLGNNSQSVARWEKGECEIPGASEKLLRATFLASLIREEDLVALKELLLNALPELDERDELKPKSVQFRLFDRWEETEAKSAA
jgi:DNA-binding transcriptional regulator YiaG